MSREVVPIGRLARRLPQAGRIRIGKKIKTRSGKMAPSGIETFRLTSGDRGALDQLAGIYGGTVRPWSEPKADPNQFELITEAAELTVVLPPDPLGDTPIYEMWGGGGVERRCDGVECQMPAKGRDGLEWRVVDCICVAAEQMLCKPHTRLSVILPEVRFAGVWRIDTKGWNAAHELPGMVDLITALQVQGLQRALLRVERRHTVIAGETKQFVVPMLAVAENIEVLAQGLNSVGSYLELEAPEDASATYAEVAPVVEAKAEGGALEPTPNGLPPQGDTLLCPICNKELADGTPVTRYAGRYQHRQCTPENAPRPTPRDVAILASKVFRPAYDAAPTGQKSKVVDRLRHALTWTLTKKFSLSDLEPDQLEEVRWHLQQIDDGVFTWESDGEQLVLRQGDEEVVLRFADLPEEALA